FGGVLRHFVLEGPALHDDEDTRRLKVITDDERPFVIYGERGTDTAPTASRRRGGDA
ncbi:MAG: manganese/iron ABC transporter ATP-binding protein, partial [Martelella sp.]